MTLRVETEPTAELLAEHIAARVNEVLVEAQERRGRASVVLTGGPTGVAMVRALAGATRTAEYVPDWSAVDIWWTDERFLPEDDAGRHAQQAAEAAERFALMVELPPENVHVIGASDQFGSAEEAAADYVAELQAAARAEGSDTGLPRFDVVLLGMSPDGHLASLPRSTGPGLQEATVVAVHDSLEPPTTRVSMTLPLISTAEQVWFVATGAENADAVSRLLGARPDDETSSADGTWPGRVPGRASTVLFATPETLPDGWADVVAEDVPRD